MRLICVGSNSPRRLPFSRCPFIRRRFFSEMGLGLSCCFHSSWTILRNENLCPRSLTTSAITACSASSLISVSPSESSRYPYGTSPPVFLPSSLRSARASVIRSWWRLWSSTYAARSARYARRRSLSVAPSTAESCKSVGSIGAARSVTGSFTAFTITACEVGNLLFAGAYRAPACLTARYKFANLDFCGLVTSDGVGESAPGAALPEAPSHRGHVCGVRGLLLLNRRIRIRSRCVPCCLGDLSSWV